MRIAGQSILAAIAPQSVINGRDPAGPEGSIGYTLPALLIDHAMRNPHVTPGFWRGVNLNLNLNLNQNTIYLECFIDEIADATGQDPVALRRRLMANHPKHLAVLNAIFAATGKRIRDLPLKNRDLRRA
jgi:isoquinoline 1-oxidoreductase beta subunit